VRLLRRTGIKEQLLALDSPRLTPDSKGLERFRSLPGSDRRDGSSTFESIGIEREQTASRLAVTRERSQSNS
jgi:hypothetical protein